MPRPKTDAFWSDRLAELAEENPRLGAGRATRALEEIAAEEGRTDAPSQRQVGRLLQAHRARPPEERALFERFRWPESCEAARVPWEAARVGLDLLRYCRERGLNRPTNKIVLWHWRVEQAAPGMTARQRAYFVSNILTLCAMGRSVEQYEWELAIQPDTRSEGGTDDGEGAYQKTGQGLERRDRRGKGRKRKA